MNFDKEEQRKSIPYEWFVSFLPSASLSTLSSAESFGTEKPFVSVFSDEDLWGVSVVLCLDDPFSKSWRESSSGMRCLALCFGVKWLSCALTFAMVSSSATKEVVILTNGNMKILEAWLNSAIETPAAASSTGPTHTIKKRSDKGYQRFLDRLGIRKRHKPNQVNHKHTHKRTCVDCC